VVALFAQEAANKTGSVVMVDSQAYLAGKTPADGAPATLESQEFGVVLGGHAESRQGPGSGPVGLSGT
jgi:hypothetical protein